MVSSPSSVYCCPSCSYSGHSLKLSKLSLPIQPSSSSWPVMSHRPQLSSTFLSQGQAALQWLPLGGLLSVWCYCCRVAFAITSALLPDASSSMSPAQLTSLTVGKERALREIFIGSDNATLGRGPQKVSCSSVEEHPDYATGGGVSASGKADLPCKRRSVFAPTIALSLWCLS